MNGGPAGAASNLDGRGRPFDEVLGGWGTKARKEGMNYRKAGFTQRKPTQPGVYFVSAKLIRPNRSAPRRNAEGWDVADIYFWAGSYDNVHENRESAAHWRIKCLDGLQYAWKPGMWTKGPISPDSMTPNVAGNLPARQGRSS